MSALRVVVDGTALSDSEAREFWKRYSDWMEGRRGDIAGFARAEGLMSVHPEMADAGPVLVASRTVPQRPYGVAPKRSVEAGQQPSGPRVGGSAQARAMPETRRRGKGGERKR